jgi:hypothetical protein
VVSFTASIQAPHGGKELPTSRAKRNAQKHAKAKQHRRQAQHATKVWEQALHNLGLPETLVAEIEGRLRSQQQLLCKIVGVMFPPLFGCRTNAELCRVWGWDKNLPSRLRSALPKRSWIKRLRRLGLEVLVPLWRHAASKDLAAAQAQAAQEPDGMTDDLGWPSAMCGGGG